MSAAEHQTRDFNAKKMYKNDKKERKKVKQNKDMELFLWGYIKLELSLTLKLHNVRPVNWKQSKNDSVNDLLTVLVIGLFFYAGENIMPTRL